MPGISDRMGKLAAYIDAHADESLTLDQLGEIAGMSQYHLQRTFKATIGVSPKEYQSAKRLDALTWSLLRTVWRRPRSAIEAARGRISESGLGVKAGEVVTYSEVARGVGAPRAVRAAASACGANRIGVLVPCHRALRSDGGLGGYRWGLDRKRLLLDMER